MDISNRMQFQIENDTESPLRLSTRQFLHIQGYRGYEDATLLQFLVVDLSSSVA